MYRKPDPGPSGYRVAKRPLIRRHRRTDLDISAPSGFATDNLFGINTQYTHILLMSDMNADIKEYGLVVWKEDEYDVQAVRPTMNVLAVALKKRTANHAAGE